MAAGRESPDRRAAATGLDPGADAPPEVLAVLDAAEEALAAFYAAWPACPGEAVGERWVALRRLPVDLEGLPGFTRRVLELLRDVPPGRTVTYSELAAAAGSPRAARAVGVVMARNPLPLIIPCHRVIGSDGGLRGFGGGSTAEGLALKERLLRYEGWAPAGTGRGSRLWPEVTGPKPAGDEPGGNIVKARV
ncbi:MAG: methylated-DNA--[protein]-cysteine S-methyltransferase [Firmicutes bacterium]|nr:methylated-DNA--[protein]-cysteine S-methyltransferase [Bacillota bacterium]